MLNRQDVKNTNNVLLPFKTFFPGRLGGSLSRDSLALGSFGYFPGVEPVSFMASGATPLASSAA